MAEINDNELEFASGGAQINAVVGTPHLPTDPACERREYINYERDVLAAQLSIQSDLNISGVSVQRRCGMCKHLVRNGTGFVCEIGQ